MPRKPGSKNLVGATAKENIIAVFTRLGSTAEMAKWAKKHQTEFYKIYARLVPTDVNHSGEIGVRSTAELTDDQILQRLERIGVTARTAHPPPRQKLDS